MPQNEINLNIKGQEFLINLKNGKKKIMLIIKKLLENMIKKKAKYFEVNPK